MAAKAVLTRQPVTMIPDVPQSVAAMNIGVIGGAGYVGMVTGAGLAGIGHAVVSVDVDEERIGQLQRGRSPIHEEGLSDLIVACLSSGRIRFTTSLQEAVQHGDVIIIAVGTPSRDDGNADLSQVIQVVEQLAELIDRYKVIVVKSTVPVGAVDLVRTVLARRLQEGKEFDLVSNPEFLREGKGLSDFFSPDRIVVGTSSEKARATMRELYAPIIGRRVAWPEVGAGDGDAVPFIETDLASAQMTKYAANAYLAMRISFINEIAALCDRVGANVHEVARGLGYDPRIGSRYLQAGLGFGGPCLEKDLRGLIRIAEANKYEPDLLRATLQRNQHQIDEIMAKIKQATGYLLYRRTIAVYGLTFKAGTDDLRNSAALRLIGNLQTEGAVVRGYDPLALNAARAAYPTLDCFEDPYEAALGAEVLVIATDWPQFRDLDYGRIASVMVRPWIVDGRNLLNGQQLQQLGFRYCGVGVS